MQKTPLSYIKEYWFYFLDWLDGKPAPASYEEDDKEVWILILENKNHRHIHVELIKSSCLPLLNYLMIQLDKAFKKMEYRDTFSVSIYAKHSKTIITPKDMLEIPETRL